MPHLNIPNCETCTKILDRYPGFYPPLRQWFLTFRSNNPDAHISSAGRGKIDQELFYSRGSSHAHYGQSAHNYNAALDFFRLTQAGGASFDSSWYKGVLGPAVLQYPELRWYGEPPITFYELPHVEWRSWVKLVSAGLLTLVDGPASYSPPKV